MLKKLQRQCVRKMDGHYQDGHGKWLVRLEIAAVRRLPSPVKHIKVVWASDGGKPKGSTGICAVVSGTTGIGPSAYYLAGHPYGSLQAHL